jgi:hypothetical protein
VGVGVGVGVGSGVADGCGVSDARGSPLVGGGVACDRVHSCRDSCVDAGRHASLRSGLGDGISALNWSSPD